VTIMRCLFAAVGVALYLPPVQAESVPLSKAEFESVVAEVWRVQDQRQRVPKEQRAATEWHELNREKLARLLQMPEFAALDDQTKEPLIDQAGAWELMPFTDPASAQAMWARWFPKRNVDKPVAREGRDIPMSSPVSYYVDRSWGIESGAMIAFFHCYPNPAWYVRHDEPMLWALEHGSGWEHANAFDFGKCVRWQSEEFGDASSETARGERSAGVIERVLSETLLNHRCTGEGPNRCLPMVHALLSLSPKHENLPAILRAIEPDFAPLDDVVIPESLLGRRGPDLTVAPGPLTDAERAQIREISRKAMLKVFFLSAKLPVLLDRPAAWPAAEVQRTVAALVSLTIVLNRTEWLSEGRGSLRLDRDPDGQYRFADPWRAIRAGGVLPEVESTLIRLGREYAREPGCQSAHWQMKELPQSFWLAYAEAKLASEQTSCGVIAEHTDAAGRYGEARRGKADSLRAIAGLRRFVHGGGAAGRDVLDALATVCSEKGSNMLDPWQICQKQAREQADAEAAKKAAESPLPPPTCAEHLPKRVARKLGYLNDPPMHACKPIPNVRGTAIVALAALSLESVVGVDSDMGDYDLDVLVVATDTGAVLSRLLIEKAYTSDAWRLSSINIDTARYLLAPGIRAFGVRVDHSSSSRVSPAGESVLSLFVEHGAKLQRVLADFPVASSNGDWDGNCAGQFSEVERRIGLATSRSNGLADLVVTTTTSRRWTKMNKDECVDGKTHKSLQRALLRFDGKNYVIPRELHGS